MCPPVPNSIPEGGTGGTRKLDISHTSGLYAKEGD
jgi:hypothetical protein